MLLAVSAVAAAVLLVASPLVGKALVPNGEPKAQDTAAVSVAILALAAYCQVWSAMLSAVLGAVRRFVGSALVLSLERKRRGRARRRADGGGRDRGRGHRRARAPRSCCSPRT